MHIYAAGLTECTSHCVHTIANVCWSSCTAVILVISRHIHFTVATVSTPWLRCGHGGYGVHTRHRSHRVHIVVIVSTPYSLEVVPSEYYLLVVWDRQCLLVAKVLSQVWSLFVESRAPSDGVTWHSLLLCPCGGVASLPGWFPSKIHTKSKNSCFNS